MMMDFFPLHKNKIKIFIIRLKLFKVIVKNIPSP